jgi:putative ABC transport system substrate-binding protein
MTRRELILGFAALGAAFAMCARAQSAAAPIPRIVVISGGDEAGSRPFLESFVQGMRQLGYIEKTTFLLDVRYADRENSRLPSLIMESVGSRPDILVVSGLIAARLARDATTTVPIVVATSGDLVEAGVVQSYAHPGGNLTGISDLSDESAVKRLELLKGALPKASRVAFLTNPDFPATPKIEKLVGAAAQALGITMTPIRATDRASLTSAVDSLAKSRPDALFVGGDSNAVQNARELIERATALRIPVAHFWPGTAEMGALFSYQADILDNFRRAASYAVRIQKGAKPGDLPVELPTRYELVVNRKTAKDFGITLPNNFLLRADRIIE